MSFDVFLFKFSKGEACELSRDAFLPVIGNLDHRNIGDDFYNVRLPDGSDVELMATGLASEKPFTSATFFIRGMSDEIIGLIFEAARATGGVLVPTMEENPCIMVDVSQKPELPSDFDLPQVECRSAEELARLLRDGYQAWSKYRDQIVHEQGGNT